MGQIGDFRLQLPPASNRIQPAVKDAAGDREGQDGPVGGDALQGVAGAAVVYHILLKAQLIQTGDGRLVKIRQVEHQAAQTGDRKGKQNADHGGTGQHPLAGGARLAQEVQTDPHGQQGQAGAEQLTQDPLHKTDQPQRENSTVHKENERPADEPQDQAKQGQTDQHPVGALCFNRFGLRKNPLFLVYSMPL